MTQQKAEDTMTETKKAEEMWNEYEYYQTCREREVKFLPNLNFNNSEFRISTTGNSEFPALCTFLTARVSTAVIYNIST